MVVVVVDSNTAPNQKPKSPNSTRTRILITEQRLALFYCYKAFQSNLLFLFLPFYFFYIGIFFIFFTKTISNNTRIFHHSGQSQICPLSERCRKWFHFPTFQSHQQKKRRRKQNPLLELIKEKPSIFIAPYYHSCS